MAEKILVVNPGSTSTKIALFDGEAEVWKENISHSREELARYGSVCGELALRYPLVRETAARHGLRPEELAAVAARGGPIAPLHSGAYEVNDEMVETIRTHPQDQHASLLGALIAYRIARETGKKAYIYDAVSVDELLPECRITGLPAVERRGQGHNLNMRAAALKLCRQEGWDYGERTLLVAHLGGGITVSLHQNGRIADIISDEDGCFSPERAGLLPLTQLVELCYSGRYDREGLIRLLKGQGGLVAWLGTNDTREAERRIRAGDRRAELVYGAMALNVAKNIARLAPVCCGRVDRIVLTGGIAYSEYFTGLVIPRVAWLAPVTVLPGENEMQALADGVLRVLRGEEKAREYHDVRNS